MFKKKNTAVGLLYYSDLIPELEHYFTTRGVDIDSIPAFIGVKKDNFIHPTQTHSSNVNFANIGELEYPETDALILTNHEQAVYLRFADCTPVILYDKKANVGAIAHAGWRGTVSSIVKKTVNKMQEYSRSRIEDIYAVIGPAIGICCYKVGDEVLKGIQDSAQDTSNAIIQKEDGIYIDLKSVNAQQLIELGIPTKNIDICPFCTSCNNDLFYSYRKEGTSLRHNAIIKLRQP